jgi:hypothetical protein
MLAGVAVRALLLRGEKRVANREAARWLHSGSAIDLLASVDHLDRGRARGETSP